MRYIQKERRQLLGTAGGTARGGSTSRRSSDGRDIFADCTRGSSSSSSSTSGGEGGASPPESPGGAAGRPPGLGADCEGPDADAQRLAQAQAREWRTCHSIISDTSDESGAS